MAETIGPILGSGPGGSTGGITAITSDDDSVLVTDSSGPIVDLSVASGAATLALSYNGTGPVDCVVLKYIDYDPTTGGVIFVMLSTDLGVGEMPVVAGVDSTGTIQSMMAFNPSGTVSAYDIDFNQVGFFPQGLQLNPTTGNPGDTPNGITAQAGMMLYEDTGPSPTVGSIWICAVGAPGATWKTIAAV